MYKLPMRRYTAEDFRTPFAKQQAADLQDYVDWNLLSHYDNTDIFEVGSQAVLEEAREKQRPPQPLTENGRTFSLSNGSLVGAATINAYLASHNTFTVLHSMKLAEDFIEANPTLKGFKESFSELEMPQPGQLNFLVFMRIYPLESSIMFFQDRLAREIINPFVGNAVFNEVQKMLFDGGIGTGPLQPPLTKDSCIDLIQKGWPVLDEKLKTQTIPAARRTGRDSGFGGTSP